VGAGVLGEHHHAVAQVEQRRLLGDQVHAVEDRVDHEHVVVLVPRHRLGEVLVDTQVDRHPVGGAVTVVDDCYQRLDPFEVLGVFGHVLAGRLQVGDEGDPFTELRVLGEECVEGGEAAQHVLGEVGPVDPEDQELASAGKHLHLGLGDFPGGSGAMQSFGVDRQRIRPDQSLATVMGHGQLVVIDLQVQQSLAAGQEVDAVVGGVEADDVVAEEAVKDGVADAARQHPPGIRLGPRDVDEVMQEHVRALGAHHARQQVQVIVVDHHHRLLDALDLGDNHVGEVLVDRDVPVVVGLDLVLADVRRVGQVPQVVLDEPQHRVGDDVVEAVVGDRVGLDQPHVVLAAAPGRPHAQRLVAGLGGLQRVRLGHRGGDPHQRAMGGQAGERGHQASGPARYLAVVLERDRAAVGDEHEATLITWHGHALPAVARTWRRSRR